MPAKSRAQQQAAGIALAASRGDIPKSKLRGASAQMAKMGTGNLRKFAKTKHKGKPKHVTERAAQVVAMLLEEGPERVCAACEKERGVQRSSIDPNVTHGMCKRHFAAMYSEVYSPEQIAAMPDEKFSPDTSMIEKPKASFYPSAGGPSSV